MKILITGGLGFVGTEAAKYFISKGHNVTLVDHSPSPKPYTPKEATYVFGDTTLKGSWQNVVSEHDVVINLAGASIFQRWSDAVKRKIYDSRIKTTENVVEALRDNSVLLSTSAVGYYGDGGERILREYDPPGNDFLAGVCVDWEQAARHASEKGVRVVIMRFGIILGKTGGALGEMLKAFRRGLGGPLGNGNQWFSWIHMTDLLRAMEFTAQEPSFSGVFNFCAPNPVRNKELASVLGKLLGKPAFFKTPGFVLRLVLGEFGKTLLMSQRVVPERLLQVGFRFLYPDIHSALSEVISEKN
ncbi:MAG: TIGR01777 family oxidoreductase [Thermodesulforhabdaceae bacterium]